MVQFSTVLLERYPQKIEINSPPLSACLKKSPWKKIGHKSPGGGAPHGEGGVFSMGAR